MNKKKIGYIFIIFGWLIMGILIGDRSIDILIKLFLLMTDFFIFLFGLSLATSISFRNLFKKSVNE